jgi:predicted transcriptional regulator
MDAPLPTVDDTEEIENIIPLFSASTPALVVERDGQPVSIISRSDLLEYIAHQRNAQK